MTQGNAIRFPAGFMWGTATSAHQVEGGNRWNDWWRWEHRSPDIDSRLQSGDACRHWERFDKDFALAEADAHNAHRLSLEWSRIEPAPGSIDEAALAHYDEVFASLRRHRLTPVVTLSHFTLPAWVADLGGWESRATLDRFDAFVRLCARRFGAEVDWWCTVNEPEVLAFRAYSEGLWPPNVRDESRALAVLANQLEAHGRAYRILHEEDRVDADGDGHAARVGLAKHLIQFEPLHAWSPLDYVRAHVEDRVFNQAVLDAVVRGRIDLSIPGARAVRRTLPALERSLDWIGLNYYTRWQVDAVGHIPHVARRGAPTTDLDWEVYPEGLALAARRAALTGVPVLVTEHGFADATDRLRPRALVESLAALGREIERGVPVLGYLHWSLMDNFEWADGWHGRFGLYGVDPTVDPGARVRTRSAAIYAGIARENAVTPETIASVAGD
jgi:beta-glucosidase